MQIRIIKDSEVPMHEQLAEQIILSIATEKLRPGEALPSVRELARRLKIHHNTVSHAYQVLVRQHWLVRKHGSRVIVRSPKAPTTGAEQGKRDLDDLINATIDAARERGYSLQALRACVRERLLARPPDHILVLEQEEGLRQVLNQEIASAARWPVESSSRDHLRQNPGLAIGALVVTAKHALPEIELCVPKARPAVSITYSPAEEYLLLIQELREPSVVAVASVSELFLKMARAFLAPSLGNDHTLQEVYVLSGTVPDVRSADLVFCDSVACKALTHRKLVEYRLIDPSSLQYVVSAMESYQDV